MGVTFLFLPSPGYWLGMLGRHTVANDDNGELWRLIWNFGGPPKLSYFVWQACKGSMAMMEVSFRRHISEDELCI